MFLILPAGTVDSLRFILILPATIALPGSSSDHNIPLCRLFVDNGLLQEGMLQGIK